MNLHTARQHNLELVSRAQARRLHLPDAVAATPSGTGDVVLRLASAGDAAGLDRLAQLEGRYGIDAAAGSILVAEVRGEILTAKPLGGGAALADPFRSTAWLVELLDVGAARLRGDDLQTGRGRRIRAATGRLLGHGREAKAGAPAVPCSPR